MRSSIGGGMSGSKLATLLLLAAPLGMGDEARAFFLDGEGHYGMRGETRTAPGFSKDKGTYQAIEQSFDLLGEVRANDELSFFMNLRLFPNERSAYLGDDAKPEECVPRSGTDSQGKPVDPDANCEDRHQNIGEPRYKDYLPRINMAFARYAFDFCILEAGRRPRDWGLGIFLDSGRDPFEYESSVFDGVDCKINVQKSQVLGFSIGFDKLQETGRQLYDPYTYPGADARERQAYDNDTRGYGPNDAGDDVDQFFFTIEYDDRRANAGASFTKQIGVYFSQANAKSLADGGANTDLKFLDLYTGLYFSDLAFRNELLFRMGKSADPSFQRLGGARLSDGDPATNKVQTIALAGEIEWTMSRSGAVIGPAEYNRGSASRHLMLFQYAYAPGDEKGYYGNLEDGVIPTPEEAARADETYGEKMRSKGASGNKAEALAFHRNYKPALIFFNGHPDEDDLIRDGVFHPSRVMNASLYAIAYKYESIEGGNVEVKAITGHLNEAIPAAVKDFYASKDAVRKDEQGNAVTDPDGNPLSADSGNRPPGYYGLFLGYELDVVYSYKFGRNAELGFAAAAALPGKAWKTNEDREPVNNFLLQGYATFNF